MAAAPAWKVYSPEGEYRAACKGIEEAACLVSFLGEGATIRHNHKIIVWTEGKEAVPASESFDNVAVVAFARIGM